MEDYKGQQDLITSTILPDYYQGRKNIIHFPLIAITIQSFDILFFQDVLNLIISSRHSLKALINQIEKSNHLINRKINSSDLNMSSDKNTYNEKINNEGVNNEIHKLKNRGIIKFDAIYCVGSILKRLIEDSQLISVGRIFHFKEIADLYSYLAELSPRSMLYLRGETITAEIPFFLRNRHSIKEIICYKNNVVEEFSSEIISKFKNNKIKSIFFHSRLAVDNFLRIINNLFQKNFLSPEMFENIRFDFFSDKLENDFYKEWLKEK